MASGGGFQVEYAKSGRASCRNTKCKGNIVSEHRPVTGLGANAAIAERALALWARC